MKKYMGLEWKRTKTSQIINGQPIVTYEEQSGGQDPFRIICTPEGVKFAGQLSKFISGQRELTDWAELFSIAWKDHKQIIPQITTDFERPQ